MGVEIDVRIDELLKKRDRSFYWLAKETGISYTTLWRLKKGKALGLNFATLSKLCRVLDCEPGDVMKLRVERKKPLARTSRTSGADRSKHGKSKGVSTRGN
jgi:putative transcriptional regulator